MTAQKKAEAINLLYPRVKGPINSLEYKKTQMTHAENHGKSTARVSADQKLPVWTE